jgi:hypothetical protein
MMKLRVFAVRHKNSFTQAEMDKTFRENARREINTKNFELPHLNNLV